MTTATPTRPRAWGSSRPGRRRRRRCGELRGWPGGAAQRSGELHGRSEARRASELRRSASGAACRRRRRGRASRWPRRPPPHILDVTGLAHGAPPPPSRTPLPLCSPPARESKGRADLALSQRPLGLPPPTVACRQAGELRRRSLPARGDCLAGEA
jgi:hypothetical protein